MSSLKFNPNSKFQKNIYNTGVMWYIVTNSISMLRAYFLTFEKNEDEMGNV